MVGQFLLGGNLCYMLKSPPLLPPRIITSVVVAKLVVVPMIGLIYFYFMFKYTDLGNNIPLAYVAFLVHVVPSATYLLIFAQMYDFGVNQMIILIGW
jgi:hypothetical protein